MSKRTAIIIFLVFFIAWGIRATVTETAMAQGAENSPSMERLEGELSEIEKELTDLEREINTLLEDLVDPKITSLTVFFSSSDTKGRVPASLQLTLDQDPLATLVLGETDRLILVRGGALEVYSGIIDHEPHVLTVECTLNPAGPGDASPVSIRSAFSIENRRAAQNFLEISLSEQMSTRGTQELKFIARHWSREP